MILNFNSGTGGPGLLLWPGNTKRHVHGKPTREDMKPNSQAPSQKLSSPHTQNRSWMQQRTGCLPRQSILLFLHPLNELHWVQPNKHGVSVSSSDFWFFSETILTFGCFIQDVWPAAIWYLQLQRSQTVLANCKQCSCCNWRALFASGVILIQEQEVSAPSPWSLVVFGPGPKSWIHSWMQTSCMFFFACVTMRTPSRGWNWYGSPMGLQHRGRAFHEETDWRLVVQSREW